MSLVVEFIKMGKKGKQILKKLLKGNTPVYMSSVRRIEQVKTNERICAMTFDDGPFNLLPSPNHSNKCLTLTLLETLEKYDAKGTFDIIGDTSENYPDEPGKEGTSAWGGVKFDHYPDINKDEFGGAVHCPELVQRIIDGGHELSNHGYWHRLFGAKNVVYGKRITFHSIDEVVEDLNKLHTYVKEKFNYEMKLSRPPHYVDKIEGGHTSYDAYHEMGYQYMAASYDGAGWLPCSTYEEEVKAMYVGMEALLAENPDALCGQIIFQKDGYNMARRTPVADGLGKQLEILKKYGYKVVTVSELMSHSAFKDLGAGDEGFKEAMALIEQDYCIGYKDNTVKMEHVLKRGELAFMLYGKEGTSVRTKLLKQNSVKVFDDVEVKFPYSGAIKLAVEKQMMNLKGNNFESQSLVNVMEFNQVVGNIFENYIPLKGNQTDSVTHKMAIMTLGENVLKAMKEDAIALQ